MSLKRNAISGIVWSFSQQFGTQIIQFLTSILLARLLLPAEFGLIGMISVFVAIGTSLMNSGLTQSLIRTENPDQEDFSTVFYFNLGASIIIYLALVMAAPFVANFFSEPLLVQIIRIYCLSFIINAFSAVQSTRLTKAMDFRTQMIVGIPSIIVSGIVGVILAYQGLGVWSLVWMSLCQAFLNALQLWWRTGWCPSLIFNLAKFKYHFKFGYKLTLSGLLDTIFNNIYQIIIGKFFVAAQVGFYTRSNSLKQLPVTNISGALNKVSYPLFAAIQNDDVRLKRAYEQIMTMVIFTVAPILTIMGVLAEPIFRLMFTEKWLPAVPYFQILCLAGILHPINSYNLNVLKVKGRSDLFLKLELVKKILIVITISITIQFGIIGLVWGQLFTSVLAFFINSYYTGKLINYNTWQQVKNIFPILTLAFLTGIIVFSCDFIMRRNEHYDLSRILLGGLIGLSAFGSIAWIARMNAIEYIKGLLKRDH